jgi:hypothetical protein
MTEPKTICVDFDQTICDSNYPSLGPPKMGAREALQALRDMGFRIIVSSCRSCGWNWELYYPGKPFVPACDRPTHKDMESWLRANRMPFDIIDDGTLGKVSATYYVDDKAIRFENNWEDVVRKVSELEYAKPSTTC